MTRIAIIGTGYVGLVSAACFAEIGHDCTCADVDAAKVARINAGDSPIHENGLTELLQRHVGTRLRATTDLGSAVRGADMTFIAVGTPFDGERIDLSQIRTAASQIGAALRGADGPHVVVVKSTVVPGTTDEVVAPELARASGRRIGAGLSVGMNPEFLTEGVAVHDFMNPDRIVLGGDAAAIAAQRTVYAPFKSVPVLETNTKTAEMIKYASNSVLATLISFSNEFARLCDALGGVDIAEVMRGVHAARYFTVQDEGGARHAAPITSFLWAGCGYGGSCLPKDTRALVSHGAAHGVDMRLLRSVIEVNAGQPHQVIAQLEQRLGRLAGRCIAVLGLAFKEDTDDVRESPAVPLVRLLLERGARVTAYDPIAMDNARALLGREVTFAPGLEEAIAGQDALVLVTRWSEFKRLPRLLASMVPQPLLFDGRRMLDPTDVAQYAGIGAGRSGGMK